MAADIRTQAAAKNPPRLIRIGRWWLKALFGLLVGIAVLLVLATGALWWWAGSDGSLATVLRWAAERQPVVAEDVTGSLRAGGRVGRLRWAQSDLSVEVRDLTLGWQPWALLDGKIQIDRLAAAEVSVNDRRPPDPAKPPGPPDSLRLPLEVEVTGFEVGRVDFDGPARVAVSKLAGNYVFDGADHKLALSSAEYATGRYSGRASLSADAPLTLQADVMAKLQADVPNGVTAVPLTVQASASGPLTDLRARATLEAAPGGATPPPQGQASARVAPWAAQPLREADATFRDLDTAAFFPEAPQTRLTGSLSVRPLGNAASLVEQAWALKLSVDNALPGPWDKRRLPLDDAQIVGEWRNGVALVRSLKATLGRGEITANGQWERALATGPSSTPAASAPGWRAEADLKNIDPARIHSQLAALPISGAASARSAGTAIAFDVDLRAANAGAPAAARRGAADTADLLLTLREAAAKGSWNGQRGGGTLDLSALRIRTDDAELSGRLEVQPERPAGAGKLMLVAPGMQADAQGELQKASGGGNLNLRVGDVQQALQWLKKLPRMPDAVQSALATGSADLTANWQGGWNDPALQVRLAVPSFDWRMGSGSDKALPEVLKLRGVRSNLTGRLSQAALDLQGRAQLGTRLVDLQLAGSAGRGPPPPGSSSPLGAPWQASVDQLALALEDASLGAGTWRLATRSPVAMKWTPAATPANQAQFEAGAGQAVLTAPARRAQTGSVQAAGPQATLAWQPVRWRTGELVTAGKVTGLSMAWLELFAGPQLADAGLTGNLLLEGEWNAVLGDSVQLQASLGRVSGDMNMQAETAQRTSARVAAGIRQARVSLTSRGEALTLAVNWESERAGVAEGRLDTRLSRSAESGAGGWTWASDAPLEGRLKAQLPRIGVWSLLAPPGWRLRGALATDLSVAGTRADPKLSGSLQADDLAMRSLADGIEFGDGVLRARLDGTRMRIDEFSLQGVGEKGSGGLVTASGEAGWINGRPEVRINAKLDRLKPSLRADRQATVSGTIQASLIGNQAELGGKLVVDQARIVLPEEGTPQLGEDVVVRTTRGVASGQTAPAQTSEAPRAVATSAASTDNANRTVKLAILIDLGPDFQLEGKGISTKLRGALALSGESFASPRLNGTITTVGGQYRAYGQRLDVERGVLRFTGAIDNPSLDILAIRPNISQRVGLEILGTALLPRVRLYSQPELPDAEKLSWLIVGRASGSGGAEAALLQQAALALLGSKGGGMSGGLAASLGLDELSFKGASSNADGGATQAAVTLGKRFSSNFYAAYERSISGALGTLFVFYDLSQRFTVRAQAGQQAAVDLIYTFSYD